MWAKTIMWLNTRYPIMNSWRRYFTEYYVPENLNVWYCFGVLAVFVLAIQFLSGLWLTFFYIPTTAQAFASLEMMMREINFGWLFRYLHTTGASAFFIIIYLHIIRNLIYGSYKKPRELIWLTGYMLYLLLMVEAFCGYVLPWGQMSYWAVQVMTSTLSAIPYIGDTLMIGLRGDYKISNAILQRCFAVHVIIIPWLLVLLIKTHITALRHTGANNPTGSDNIAKIPFHPYYTVKDLFAVAVFLLIFIAVVCFMPDMGGYFLEANNFLPADALQTPAHISTPWYIAPFYAILRAVPDKLLGIIATLAAILLWFCLPWLDQHPIKPLRQRTLITQCIMATIIISFCGLGYLGLATLSPLKQIIAQSMMGLYFSGFILLTVYSRVEKNR